MIETTDVSKQFGAAAALTDISTTVDGGAIALLGRNGAGKTTLMSIMAGLARESTGTVAFDGSVLGRNRACLRDSVTLLPQTLALDPTASARASLEYLLRLRGQVRDGVADTLDTFDLGAVADRPIGTLSGGLRQRVGLAYAFLMRSPLLLLDEPTAGLDPIERLNVARHIARTATERTVVYSTHTVSDVDAVATRVIVLDGGWLAFDGTPERMRAEAPAVHTAVVDASALETVQRTGRLTAACRVDGDRFAVRWFGDLAMPDADEVEPTLSDAYIALVAEVRG